MNKHLARFINTYFADGLTCQGFTEAITDYLEGTLTFRQRIRFQIHLGLCLGCRRYLRQMKLAIVTLGKLPDTPAPPEIQNELMQRFRNWKSETR